MAGATTTSSLDVSKRDATINLGAGPSSLPTAVLLEAAQGLLDFQGTGMGLTELSHRSSTFKAVVDSAEASLRALLDIPDDYAVLFTQGGGTEQFSATALNMLSAHASRRGPAATATPTPAKCDYVVTGSWTAKAVKEAKRLGVAANVAVDAREHNGGKFGVVPPVSAWKLSSAASAEDAPAMLYYCDNETVDGVEFPAPGFPIDELPADYAERVPLVADCSSNILSRPIDVRRHALIFFGAQKNVGPSGVTVVIVRRNLIAHDPDAAAVLAQGGPRIPTTLVYKNLADNASLYNTPPMFSIYVAGLVFADLLKHGGVAGATERAAAKSGLVYGAIADSQGLFVPTVAQAAARSRMNVTFRVVSAEGTPDDGLEARFVAACAQRGIVQVKGHRSVGGIRCSLYNAVTLEQTAVLVDVMRAFIADERSRR
ncbi:hypothetical protein L7F22_008675 [Adiantum nelumboides]|nr:hypothetical protein [Adiantum nelumboides]